jgi:hypothetical protein
MVRKEGSWFLDLQELFGSLKRTKNNNKSSFVKITLNPYTLIDTPSTTAYNNYDADVPWRSEEEY